MAFAVVMVVVVVVVVVVGWWCVCVRARLCACVHVCAGPSTWCCAVWCYALWYSMCVCARVCASEHHPHAELEQMPAIEYRV